MVFSMLWLSVVTALQEGLMEVFQALNPEQP